MGMMRCVSAVVLVLMASTSGASLHAGRMHFMARPRGHRLHVGGPPVLSVAPESKDGQEARSAIRTSSVNLAKNIICGGFLSLPAGVAACARTPTPLTLLPGSVLLLGMGVLSAYCFGLIGRTCALMREPTYQGAWRRAVGKRGSRWVAISLSAKTGATCLSYSMILADMVAQISGWPRAIALLATTGTTLLPLCLIDTSKTFKLLKYSSAIGLGATGFVVGVMGLRWGTRAYASGGHLLAAVPPELQPQFGGGGLASTALFGGISPRLAIFISMLATAFMAHYNAPAFLRDSAGLSVEEEKGADGTTTARLSAPTAEGLARFHTTVALSFSVSALTFLAVAAFGYLTFGGAAAGNVLTNYARTDGLAVGARAAIAVSLLAGYPLAFANLQKSCCDALAATRVPLPPRAVSLCLLGMLTASASVLTDLGFVSAFAGALLGSAIIYVYPSIMFRRALLTTVLSERQAAPLDASSNPDHLPSDRRLRIEAALAQLITAAGVALMVLGGGVVALKKLGGS